MIRKLCERLGWHYWQWIPSTSPLTGLNFNVHINGHKQRKNLCGICGFIRLMYPFDYVPSCREWIVRKVLES